MKWLWECEKRPIDVAQLLAIRLNLEQLVFSTNADLCPCGCNCEGRPIPESDEEWEGISLWWGWPREWREQYERGEYPYKTSDEAWWTDHTGHKSFVMDSAHLRVWLEVYRMYGLKPPDNLLEISGE